MDDTARRMSSDESRTEELRSEIAQTRADMSETIDAIQDKLRPGNIAAAATDRIKDATSRAATRVAGAASDTAHATMARTRQLTGNGGRGSGVARAMIGVGTAWLIIDRWRNSGSGRQQWRRSSYSTAYQTAQWRRPEDYYASPSSYAEDDMTNDEPGIGERTQEMRTRAKRQGERAMDGFERLLRSNPLMVAAAAMAVGAAVGLALPETERENEWLGEAREGLLEHAQDVARSTASHVRQAAGDIAGQVASEMVGADQPKGDQPKG
jgi:hypothetical protein